MQQLCWNSCILRGVSICIFSWQLKLTKCVRLVPKIDWVMAMASYVRIGLNLTLGFYGRTSADWGWSPPVLVISFDKGGNTLHILIADVFAEWLTTEVRRLDALVEQKSTKSVTLSAPPLFQRCTKTYNVLDRQQLETLVKGRLHLYTSIHATAVTTTRGNITPPLPLIAVPGEAVGAEKIRLGNESVTNNVFETKGNCFFLAYIKLLGWHYPSNRLSSAGMHMYPPVIIAPAPPNMVSLLSPELYTILKYS